MKHETPCLRAITRWVGQSAFAVGMLGLGAVGCGQPDVAEDQSTSESFALFKDPSTSGPRLDVYDADGFPAIAVSGPIGSEGMLAGFKGGDSLIELYRAVHPDLATVPEDLVALDEIVAPQLAALRTFNREPRASVPSPTIEKSLASFSSKVCNTFIEGSVEFRPMECKFAANDTSGLKTTSSQIMADDRTYGWNNTSGWSFIRWTRGNNVAGGMGIPAHYWNWFTIGGGGPYRAEFACISSPQFPGNCVSGERGLTWHMWFPRVT